MNSNPYGPPKGVETAVFAARNLIRPQTVRKRYAQSGSYHGIRPIKLASGRLLWPDAIAVKQSKTTNEDTSAVKETKLMDGGQA
jgi:hypothetical protein